MFMSNTATSAMLVPMGDAITSGIKHQGADADIGVYEAAQIERYSVAVVLTIACARMRHRSM